MPRLTTFGFEAEYAVGAAAVIERLHALGFAGSPTLHGYHCDCEDCYFRNGWAFRGQTDSSCSGEIISDIFGDPSESEWEAETNNSDELYDPPSLMARLAQSAIEVDAEPGLNSGFHVHVGIGGLDVANMREALWQFIRWEPVLARIGGGRWADQRAGVNTTVRDCTRWEFGAQTDSENYTEARIRDCDPSDEMLQALLNAHQCADRHSNLNIGSRRVPTWEFRLWNSTRAAWRMEMFCGLSVALVDPDVVTALSELQPPIRRRTPANGVDAIASALVVAGHDSVAELVTRQARYLDERAGEAPASLTLV